MGAHPDLSSSCRPWEPDGPPWIHARRAENEVAICGEAPHVRDFWSDKRSRITCAKCLAEIERRFATRKARKG